MTAPRSTLRDMLEPGYLETRFRAAPAAEPWPGAFAIISAYATTGERWTPEENATADRELERVVRALDTWIWRIIGFSLTSEHSEPGWAVELPFDEACDLGLRFRQDAIYYIRDGTVFVSFCDERRGLVPVAPFAERFVPDRASSLDS